MHRVGPASSIIAIVAVAALIFEQTLIEDLGLLRLFRPVSVLLLLPAVAGIAVAVAAENTVALPLPDPPAARGFRAAWATLWTLIAAVSVVWAAALDGSPHIAPSLRNVAIYSSIGLVFARLGWAHMVWLPAVLLTLISMMFGYRNGGQYHWWATVVDNDVSTVQALTVGLVFLLAISNYVSRWPTGSVATHYRWRTRDPC